MKTYISLVRWTDQGSKGVEHTLDRAAAAENLAEKLGGHIRDIRWTMGRYDLVVTLDAPTDETASAIMWAIGSLGNIHTETMRAFDKTEVMEVLTTMP